MLLGLSEDNGKENGNYFLIGLYRVFGFRGFRVEGENRI